MGDVHFYQNKIILFILLKWGCWVAVLTILVTLQQRWMSGRLSIFLKGEKKKVSKTFFSFCVLYASERLPSVSTHPSTKTQQAHTKYAHKRACVPSESLFSNVFLENPEIKQKMRTHG